MLSEEATVGQVQYLTETEETPYLFIRILLQVYSFLLTYRNVVNVMGKRCHETLSEFCRRTLHARLQTGPGGGNEQSELPLTNFCLLVDFLLDIVSLVRTVLFVTNPGIWFIVLFFYGL